MSDMGEPTAYEQLDPAKTGSVLQLAPRLPSSARHRQATEDDFRTELTACLALCVPSGMTEESRRDWLIAAWGTLGHLPADLLRRGCAKARQVCDHPAKIVPVIIAETAEAMRMRREYGPPSDYTALPSAGQGAEKLFSDWLGSMKRGMIPQHRIDDKPDQWRRIAVERGALRHVGDGRYIQREHYVDRHI